MQGTHTAQAFTPCRQKGRFRLTCDRVAEVFCTRSADEEHCQPKENTQAH
jgi:hypothetical protein